MTSGSAARAIQGRPRPPATAAAAAPRSKVLRPMVVICTLRLLRRPLGRPPSGHLLVPAIDDRVAVLVGGVPVKHHDLLGPVAVERDQRPQIVRDFWGPARWSHIKAFDQF